MEICYLSFLILFSSSYFVSSESPEEIRNEQGRLMHSYMNSNLDPCNNFYEYACGKFGNSDQPGRDPIRTDAIEALVGKVNNFFKDAVLFNNYTSDSNGKIEKILETSEVRRIKDYYMLCRRQKGTKYQPYIQALNFPGGWPVLNDAWNDQQFDWLNITAQLKLFNVPALMDVNVSPHFQNATRNTIFVNIAHFSARSFLERNPVTDAVIISSIKKAFEGLGLNSREIAKITDQIIEFNTELAKIVESDSEENDDSDQVNEVTLGTIGKLVPGIDFKRYMKIVFGKDLPESQEVILFMRPYFLRLVKLLNKTDSEVLANYFFFKFTSAIEHSEDKKDVCVDEIINYFGFALSHIYNLVFNDERSNKDAELIATNIKNEFRDTVANTAWIDEKTKEESIAKVNNINMLVGGSRSIDAYDTIKQELLDIDLDFNDYHKSFLNLIAYTVRKSFKSLDKLNSNTNTEGNTAVVNAFYDKTRNHIVIPTNILQTPTYNYNFPSSVKYGSLGMIIGHELTHSLDASGTDVDSKGSFRKWWSNEAFYEYTKRSACILDQYSNYTPKVTNGSLQNIKSDTVDENIADNGGIRLAYQAYQKWLQNNSDKDETLPYVNLTNNQLFFLSFAQFFCQKINTEDMVSTLLNDEHGLNEHRVIGALANFEKFSEVFNCPLASTMNPAKKCRVW